MRRRALAARKLTHLRRVGHQRLVVVRPKGAAVAAERLPVVVRQTPAQLELRLRQVRLPLGQIVPPRPRSGVRQRRFSPLVVEPKDFLVFRLRSLF